MLVSTASMSNAGGASVLGCWIVAPVAGPEELRVASGDSCETGSRPQPAVRISNNATTLTRSLFRLFVVPVAVAIITKFPRLGFLPVVCYQYARQAQTQPELPSAIGGQSRGSIVPSAVASDAWTDAGDCGWLI
jgi:hypothetical protein